jgi:uncharacterized protein YdiU (UPF0061 family)
MHIYNFPKYIRELISLKIVDYQQIFRQLKQIKPNHRVFYVKFWAVNFHVHATEKDTKKILKKLLNFCKSERADFKLTVDDLKKYTPSQKELEQVMGLTKKFWLNNDNTSRRECKKNAITYLKAHRKISPSHKKQKTLV